MTSLLLKLLTLVFALAHPAAGAWNSTSGVNALDAVETALHKVAAQLKNSTQLKNATRVVEEVERAVHEVESKTSGLTKAEKAKRISRAIAELQGLQGQWEQVASLAGKKRAVEGRMGALKRKLAEKRVELKKDEGMLKLVRLEKQLAEKKMELKGLLERKSRAREQEEARDEDARQQAMVANLVTAAKSLAATKKRSPNATVAGGGAAGKVQQGGRPAALKAILADLRARASNASAAIGRFDADETSREKNMDGNITAPTTGKGDAIAKGQSFLRLIKKEAHRAYLKARAVKQANLQELNEAIRTIERGDAGALQKLMAKMQGEEKALTARTHGFLY